MTNKKLLTIILSVSTLLVVACNGDSGSSTNYTAPICQDKFTDFIETS